ncbi:MAG: pirin family protein [Dehalococcoidia bacterium]|nr:pirin family protein [Dehalococcoidia bacterium]
MLEVRRADEIHHEQGYWFDARWHFSFDRYRDPAQMGVGPLRVFNDDRLIEGAAWPMHPHADVEGITYVVEGHFEHADSLGNGGRLESGGVQRMTLGSGAEHSERNASEDEPMRFLQLWIFPETSSLPPEIEQRQFQPDDFRDRLHRVLGPDGHGNTVHVHQDAALYVARPTTGVELEHRFPEGRGGYLYVIDGALDLEGDDDGERLAVSDSAKVYGPHALRMRAAAESHFVLVDVPLEYTPVGVWAR